MSSKNSSNQQHTPGPWFLNLENAVVNPMLNVIIGHVEYLDDVDEARANARLIAAAPELLAALEWYISSRPEPKYPSEGYLKARAAIAKAKGVQS